MSQNKCDKCKKPATDKCGQCSFVSYCSRECQKIAWPDHKSICLEIKTYGFEGVLKRKRDSVIDSAIKAISGNVFIMASHHDADSEVVITINETIDQFTSSRNHCAFLNAVKSDNVEYPSSQSATHVVAVVQLSDYQYKKTLPIMNLEMFRRLKIINSNPGEDWPVFFNT